MLRRYTLCFQDDPLSALDVHVGAHIYKHAIENFLLKQGKTVVLVTHQLQYIPHADQVRRTY